VERAEKSRERSVAVSGSRKNERSAEREVPERKRSGEEITEMGFNRYLYFATEVAP